MYMQRLLYEGIRHRPMMLEGDQSPRDPLVPRQLYHIVDSVPAEVDKEVKPNFIINKSKSTTMSFFDKVNYKVIPLSMNAIPSNIGKGYSKKSELN